MAEHPQFEVYPRDPKIDNVRAEPAGEYGWRYRLADRDGEPGEVATVSAKGFLDRESAEGDVIRFIESVTAHAGAPSAFIEPSTGIEYVIAHVEA